MGSSYLQMPRALGTRAPWKAGGQCRVEWRQFVAALRVHVAPSRWLGQLAVAVASSRKTSCTLRGARFYVAVLVAVAVLPLVAPKPYYAATNAPPFPGWPVLEPGSALPALPLTKAELGFARNFPGKIGKFGNKHRSYVVRWVTTPTRRLHPAEDCYRASGFTIRHESRCPVEMSGGTGCFTAENKGVTLLVQELITDSSGKTFSDVSAWYWAAVRGISQGPWWSVTKVTAR